MTKNEKLDRAIEYIKSFPIKDMDTYLDIINDLESLKRKIRERKEEKTEYSDEVMICFNNCLKFFPYSLHPKNPKTWYDVIEKLNRIDDVEFSEIERIVAATRANDFWGKNFLSMVKLRKVNREMITYFVVFSEKFPIQNKTSHHRNFAPDSTFN